SAGTIAAPSALSALSEDRSATPEGRAGGGAASGERLCRGPVQGRRVLALVLQQIPATVLVVGKPFALGLPSPAQNGCDVGGSARRVALVALWNGVLNAYRHRRDRRAVWLQFITLVMSVLNAYRHRRDRRRAARPAGIRPGGRRRPGAATSPRN